MVLRMRMEMDQPRRRTLRRRQKRQSRRRKWSVRPKLNRLTRFSWTIISVCRPRITRWAAEKSKKQRLRRRRRLSCRRELRRSSCKTMKFVRSQRSHKCLKTSCTTRGSWLGSTFHTIIWSRSSQTFSNSRAWKHSTCTATTSPI